MKRLTCLAALILLSFTAAFADIARPEPAKTPKVKPGKGVITSMDIRLEPDAKEARLIIPRSQLRQLRAQLDEIEAGEDDTAAITNPNALGRTQTAMAGVFMSLAFVFGGMWFIRSGKAATKTGKMLVIAVAVGGIGSAATLVYANAGPPPTLRSINGKMFSEAMRSYGGGWGQVKVEVSSTEDRIKLVVPDPADTRPAE